MRTTRSRRSSIALAVGLALSIAGGARAQTAAETPRAGPGDLPPESVREWQTGALAPDKLQHFSLAFSLGLAFGIMSGEPAAAGGAGALALAKEFADTRFDGGDLAAGLIGAGCAVLLIAYLER
jgi:hypothetical protein